MMPLSLMHQRGALALVAALTVHAGCARAVGPLPTEPLPEFSLDGAVSDDGGASTMPRDPSAVVALALQGEHSCAHMGDGTVRCWGLNCDGRLGFDSTLACRGNGGDFPACSGRPTCAFRPQTVPGLAPVAHLSGHCAAMADGTVRCLQLSPPRPGWTPVEGLTDVVEVSTAPSQACARLRDGDVACWTLRRDPDQPTIHPLRPPYPPAVVPGVAGATQVAAGPTHACARIADGTVRCWGDNSQGQLGDGTRTLRGEGVAVAGLSRAVQVVVGLGQSCALVDTGVVYCWGYPSGDTPTLVEGISEALEIAMAEMQVCARTRDGRVACWNPRPRHRTLTTVPDLTGVVEIASGGSSVCARTRDGAVRCWGACSMVQCGDPDQPGWRESPFTVAF